MGTENPNVDHGKCDAQKEHWESVYSSNTDKFGTIPSEPAKITSTLLKKESKTSLIELGAGQGRDTLYFARSGFNVTALDYSHKGIEAINITATDQCLDDSIQTVQQDVRELLPFENDSFDACYSHMLYCMPLSKSELSKLSSEIYRILKPGGLNIFTTRNTKDPQYRTGLHRGEGLWEIDGGFIVHFLSKEDISKLCEDFEILQIDNFEEGMIPSLNEPKKLYLVVTRKPGL